MAEYVNVREPWEMHDTICVCENLYGSEANAGFYATFAAFGQQLEHLFFKRRSEGNVHRAYNNQLAEDRTDFVMRVFQVGLLFIGPPTPLDYHYQAAATDEVQDFLPSYWTQDFPRDCQISLKIGQDTNLTLQAMMASPGYGPATNGAAFGIDYYDATAQTLYFPEFMYTAVQGVPIPQARYWLVNPGNPEPIGIPKGEIIEMRLKPSERARRILSTAGGPGTYQFSNDTTAPLNFATRYSIQASLWGYREVQQRGQLRAG